jgi:signal transduction histidine kinase/ligand-binding sensor domain-containing protein/CheY-like chemotaxis protein
MSSKRGHTITGAIWVLILLLAGPVAAAQQEDAPDRLEPTLHFARLTSDDGLAQNTIEAILQDSQGFMWFGTLAGLSKYDGYRFTTYRYEPENPNNLSQNWVRDLYEDRDGMIWIATEGGGMNRFDPRTETFTHYVNDHQNPNSLAGDRVFHIFQERSGKLWFVGGGLTGLNTYDPETGTFTRFASDRDDPNAFHGGAVWDIYEDEAGLLWMASDQGLVRYDPSGNRFASFAPASTSGQQEVRLTVLHPDSSGVLWAGGNQGLYQFDIQNESFTPYPTLGTVNDLLEDENGLFWIASTNGLYIFDPRTGQALNHYQHDPTQPDSLNNNQLTELYQDREGVIWIGTGEGGLNIYDPRQAQFAHYRHDPDTETSLAEGTIKDIFATDDSRLWLGVGDGVDLIDLATHQITHFTGEASEDFSGPVNVVYEDRSGTVWVGTSGFRLYQLDPDSSQFTRYPLETQLTRPTPPKAVIAFYEDDAGALWVAVNHDGIYRLDPSRQNVQFYESPPVAPMPDAPPDSTSTMVIRPPITDLYGDRAGHIWVTTLNGFHRFDPRTETFESYRATAKRTGPDSYMETLLEDQNGLIWIASRDGLIRFDPNTKATQYYTEDDGLASNYVVGILENERGDLWLSTKRGLSRFTPSTETFRNFDVSDGLQGSEFISRAFAEAADGQMFFGGINGLTAFYPEQISENPYQPPVVLTDFQLFNRPVLPGDESLLTSPIAVTNALTVNHDQNILSFEFAALSYAAPKQNHYRYKLDGFESAWNETDSARRFVTYTNLPAGNYTFRVEGTNDDGVWSDQAVALNLTVLPPWWETVWFRGAVSVLLIGLVLGGYQWRIRAIARRNRDLEREVARQTSALQQRTQELQASEEQLRQAKDAAESANRAKSAFLANMSHELRSPLNVMLGFAQVMSRDAQLPQEAHKNLEIILHSGEHLLALINQVLDLSKVEAGRMTLDEVNFDLYRLLEDIEEMFILKAQDKHLELLFDRPADLPRYLRADAVKLRQILINLIGNALKFTASGGVAVRVRGLNAPQDAALQLRFEVEDTGPGIPPDEMASLFEAFTQTSSGRQVQDGTGLGLAISRRFVELMGGEITVKSEVGSGTTFAFSVQCRVADPVHTLESNQRQRVVGLEPGQPQYRVLVVDDNAFNRQLLVKLLMPFGFELREAENGQQAVETALTFQPHLIWMDLRMPVMNGIEATRQIKAASQGQKIVVIALTASAFDEERADIVSVGCDDFLRKPFRPEEIYGMLTKHIGVRYIFEAAALESVEQADRSKAHVEDLKPALNILPADLLARLMEGTELGDIEMLERVIGDIRRDDPELADGLARLANRFEYDVLLSLVQETLE